MSGGGDIAWINKDKSEFKCVQSPLKNMRRDLSQITLFLHFLCCGVLHRWRAIGGTKLHGTQTGCLLVPTPHPLQNHGPAFMDVAISGAFKVGLVSGGLRLDPGGLRMA